MSFPILAKVSQDARPTTDAASELQLAAAMGYPKTWRVVRSIDENMIQDTIYAGNPDDKVDTWFNHTAARQAAISWVEGESTGYEHKGGHLLKKVAKFQKNDIVQVYYSDDDTWYDATIVKRIEYDDEFRYTVHYTLEDSTQQHVREEHIRVANETTDEFANAESLGLPSGWSAKPKAKGRWSIVAPDGQVFASKKKALQYAKKGGAQNQEEDDEGDPPWRKTNHEYIGRRVLYTHSQKYSGTRCIDITQRGTVVGWIADTDVDKNGEPGFVSASTGQPANLFHVQFDDEPNHDYAKHLIAAQDLEEYELLECILPTNEETGEPPRKRQRSS